MDLENDLGWFAYYCVERDMISRDLSIQIKDLLGDNLSLVLFAETILGNELYDDPEAIQELVNESFYKGQEGPPPCNIFLEEILSVKEEAPLKPTISLAMNPNEEDSSDFAGPIGAVQEEETDDKLPPMDDVPGLATDTDIDFSGSIGAVQEEDTGEILPQEPPPTLPPSDGKLTINGVNEEVAPVPEPKAHSPAPKTSPKAKAAPMPTPTPEPQVETLVEEFDESGEKIWTDEEIESMKLPSTVLPELSFDKEMIEPSIMPFEEVSLMNDVELQEALIATLYTAQQLGFSDIHFSADARPFARHNLKLRYLSDHIITEEESYRINKALLNEEQDKYIMVQQDYDFALALSEQNRFRVNLMIHKDGMQGTYRIVPNQVRSLEELGFTKGDVIRKLLTYHNGLILVTGPVGSGKTTTLASLVDEMNRNREDHIITVEDPLEIIQRSVNCNVTQREVGTHTNTFHSALKGALREDPDIIVIGELRDLETIENAITASETGHLVIGTLHTSDAGSTLNRLLDVFPPSQQPQIRAMVAESLKGIICQKLLPAKDGSLTVASEILLGNTAVGNIIREGKTHTLKAILETGIKEGMCLMDQNIAELYELGTISKETALEYISDVNIKKQIDSTAANLPASAVNQGDAPVQEASQEPAKSGKKKWGLFK